MSNITKMSLDELFKRADFLVRIEDIELFLADTDATNKLIEYSKKHSITDQDIKEWLKENEEKVDKEKLLILSIKNCRNEINFIKETIETNKRIISDNLSKLNMEKMYRIQAEIYKLKERKQKMETNLKLLQELGKDIDFVDTIYRYNEHTGLNEIKVVDYKAMIDGKERSKDKNLKRIKKLDRNIKKATNNSRLGIEQVVSSLIPSDLKEIFPNHSNNKDDDTNSFGYKIGNLAIENTVLRITGKTRNELMDLKLNDPEQYRKLFENIDYNEVIMSIRYKIEDYIEYADIDKLILISAFRFEEELESKSIRKNDIVKIKSVLEILLRNLEERNKEFKFSLAISRNNDYTITDIEYSAKKIKECLSRFTKDSYLTKEDIKDKKQKIISGELDIFDIDDEEINIIFSKKEIEELDSLNDTGFAYLSEKMNWNKQKILEKLKSNRKGCSYELLEYLVNMQKIDYEDIINLYFDKTIEVEQIIPFKKEISKFINEEELIKYYNKSTSNNAKENDKEKYSRYISLYKKIIEYQSKEERQQSQEKLMECLIDGYNIKNKEQYLNQLKEFCMQKILPLKMIIELNDEDIVKKVVVYLYAQEEVDLEEIKQLVKTKKLKFEYLSELIFEGGISREKRLKIIEQGWIPEEEIFNLYKNALILEKDLKELAKRGIVSSYKVEKLINDTPFEQIQENSNLIIEVGDDLQKIGIDENLDTNNPKPKGYGGNKPKFIINPNARLEFFSLLGAMTPKNIIISKDSPFYEYNFYIIPNEEDERNSIVIAERIYEETEEHMQEKYEKEKREAYEKREEFIPKDRILKYAVNNATYFFKHKDIVVLSNYLSKDDVIKEEKNVIFKANHILSSDYREGYWAAGVVYALTKTMLSSDLKEYSKDNRRRIVVENLIKTYGEERFKEILDKLEEIDSGKDDCEIIEDER